MSETKRMIVINKSISNKPEKSSVGLKSRRVKPNVVVRPTTLKKALLERIKKHQQRVHQHKNNDGSNYPIIAPPSITPSKPPVNTNATSFSNDFTESMEFLKQLAEKRKKTMKFRKLSQPMSTSMSIPAAPMSTSTSIPTSMPMSAPTPMTTPMSAPILNPTPTSNNTTTTINLPNQGMFPAPLVNVQVAPPYSYNNTNTIEPIRNLDLNPQFTSFEYGTNDEPKQPVIQFGENTQKEIPANDDDDEEQEQQEEPEPEPPSIFIKPEPDHGCLKGGKKPTFREWVKKTFKKPAEVIKEFLQGGGSNTDNNDENEQENDVNENDVNENDVDENDVDETGVPNDGKIAGLRMKIRKTTTKKFRVGKHGNVVGVLLKNKHTQRHIQKEHLSLKQKSLNEIKKYLYDKNLLKIGSSAPPDVLRRLYEDSILTGEVQNTGKGVALHNFMAKDDEN